MVQLPVVLYMLVEQSVVAVHSVLVAILAVEQLLLALLLSVLVVAAGIESLGLVGRQRS